MKPAYRAAGGLFVLVLLGGIVSAGVFVTFGTKLAVYAVVAIAPVLVVAGGLWARRAIQTTGTDQAEYARRRAREVGEDATDLLARYSRMRDEYPDVVADVDAGIDGLVADLDDEGIQVDTERATFTLESVGSLEDINRLDDRIDTVADELDRQFRDQVSAAIRDVNGELDRLDDVGPSEFQHDPDEVPDVTDDDVDWQAAGRALEDCRADAVDGVERAADTIREALESASDIDREAVESDLTSARTAATDHDFTTAVNDLLSARDAVRQHGDSAFRSLHRDLESLVRTVERSSADEYTDHNHLEAIEETHDALDDLDDAMDLGMLQDHRETLEEHCIDVVRDLDQQLDDAVRQLETADVPDGYYDIPDVYEQDLVADLEDASSVSAFETAWEDAVEEQVDALDDLQPKADVVSGYDQIRARIEDELRSSGRVHGDDLPVREHEEQFLGLYYRQHPDEVEFDIDQPALVAEGGTESHEVEVTARFDEGGDERDLTLTLASEGGNYEATERVSTPLVTNVTFEEVPFGECTLTVDPDPVDYPTTERTVAVDGDESVTVDLEPISLAERLCADVDDVDEYLDPLTDTFAERFEEEGFLSTSMSFRIDEEYVPCLLATWAERTGRDATECDDGTVLVYEYSQLRKELSNVAEYNLDEGESMPFDELRERFLSAPVPDPIVESLAEDCEQPVETVDTTLRK